MMGQGKLLARLVPVGFQKLDEVLVIGDALVEILGVQHVPVLDLAVGVQKFTPGGGADAVRRLIRFTPLVFVDFSLTEHFFDQCMFFPVFNFHIHPGIALDQFDLLVNLLIEGTDGGAAQ